MEYPKRIFRNLEPARPLRRLNVNPGTKFPLVPQSYDERKPIEKKDNIIKVEHFYEILHLQNIRAEPKQKAERICYTRDFLMDMASCPMAKKKPEYLPEHPVVLENARASDVPSHLPNHNYNNSSV